MVNNNISKWSVITCMICLITSLFFFFLAYKLNCKEIDTPHDASRKYLENELYHYYNDGIEIFIN